MKHRIWLWLVLGFVPLLIYPFVMLANIMTFAAMLDPNIGMKNAEALRLIVVVGFLASSSLYPVVYLSCAGKSILLFREKEHTTAIRWSMYPIAYLIIPMLLMYGWIQF